MTTPPVTTSPADSACVTEALQRVLDSVIDLSLTLKHAHWNLVGPDFISAHTMLDPQVEVARNMADDLGERIATLGVAPDGRLQAIAGRLERSTYPFGRRSAVETFEVLTEVYTDLLGAYHTAIPLLDDDPISQDLVIGQARELAKNQWFVRAHLDHPDGRDG
ncbi:DNA starvation/stationary phase protection protein [Nocardioides sp. CER19]|uniref:Dps family protein n=1 Tax=Nocardioides sp. CER19 TaxID=3038538 RepID=UPI00244A4877|nr:DNA starvation/stationary phase protection protein [Nocardioides sp. CER19]MDH2415255.1 DNA starvation/stationary phase protection protein [Nocardioides sp. CER19]